MEVIFATPFPEAGKGDRRIARFRHLSGLTMARLLMATTDVAHQSSV
jgi:hypothetical protein